MVPYDEKQRNRDFFVERAMFKLWMEASGESNEMQVEHLRRCVRVAIDEALTPKQREYLSLYLSGYSHTEIAEMCSVNVSTVSRTVGRACDRLCARIKYATGATLGVDQRVRRKLTRLYR